MNTLTEIEAACKELSEARAKLRRRHEQREKEIRVIDAEHAPELRRIHEHCSAIRTALEALVEQARPDFLKPKQPKTRVFYGIEVGFEKERDSLIKPEEAVLVKNIEQMLPASQAKTLLDRTTTVIKNAFKKLDQATLQKLGCSVVSGRDKAVVRTADDDIEALVTKALGEAKES